MAHVVLLRGVNVGGHRTFRPKQLAEQLKHLGAVNIGAAGTFVIRRRISQAQLRAELARRLPFDTQIAICQGREVTNLMARRVFETQPPRPDITCFVSVLCGPQRSALPLPMQLPDKGQWLVKVVAREGRFICGMYRRHMKTIGYLGKLDDLLGAPTTTRNWNTFTTIARVLDAGAP
jgi:uncharacterized protein (DUF1697 family)